MKSLVFVVMAVMSTFALAQAQKLSISQEPEKTAAQIQAELEVKRITEESMEPAPRKRILIPVDPKVPYFILEREGGSLRVRTVVVKRASKPVAEYRRLAFDCQSNTVKELGRGRSYQEVKRSESVSEVEKIKGRSIRDYIKSDVCAGYVIDPVSLATEERAAENAKYGYTGLEVVTMRDYERIFNGMTYTEVEKTIGHPGREISRSFIPGAPGGNRGISTVMYEWINRDGSNMNAMFQNGVLVQKAQFRLR